MRTGEALASGPDAPTFDPIPVEDFDPVHILHWEKDIVWDQQDESEDQPPSPGSAWVVGNQEQLRLNANAAYQRPYMQQQQSVAILELLPPRPAGGRQSHVAVTCCSGS